MALTTSANIEDLRGKLKKERKIMLVLPIIGILFAFAIKDNDAGLAIVLWIGMGFGASAAWFITKVSKVGILYGLYIASFIIFGGPIAASVMLFRRNSWIKKCGEALESELDSLKAIMDAIDGSGRNVSGLARQIIRNFNMTNGSFSVGDLME